MNKTDNQYFPIFLDVKTKRVLIVGGGKVAAQKFKVLQKFPLRIMVLSKDFGLEIKRTKVKKIQDIYKAKYLKGIDLVFACTNDRIVNAQIKKDANQKNILVNVVDDPTLCDFIMPAIFKQKEMTVAVSSGGKNVRKSVGWRDKIKELFEK